MSRISKAINMLLQRRLIVVAFAVTASSQLFLPSFLNFRKQPSRQPLPQSPLMAANDVPGIALPPSSSEGGSSGPIIISDVISRDRSINIFAGLSRDISSVSGRLDDQSQNTTVLAPLNSVVTNLPRKPWEDPRDYGAQGAQVYEGQGGQDKAQANLRRFVEAHIIPTSPWKEGDKVKSLVGTEVWWEKDGEGKKVLQPGNIEITSIADKVANGEIWIIKGVVNYA